MTMTPQGRVQSTSSAQAIASRLGLNNKTSDVESKHSQATEATADDDSEFTPVGVTRVEAFYALYDSRWKIGVFWTVFLFWMFAYTLSADTTYVYVPFATSAFSYHSLVGTITVVCTIMSGVVQPFWGKIADLFSRPWALTAAVFLYTLGYIVVSASNRVSAVAAGQVIYTAGNAGMIFVQTLLVADITSLQWRGLVLGLVSLPYIPFAFVSGYITDAVSLSNWRWGFGMFCIIMPVAVLPVLMVLFWSEHKAKETGSLSVAASSYTYQLGLDGTPQPLCQRVRHALNVIDAVGLVLMGFSFALLLSPPTLVATATGGWKNPSMIAMMTVGGVLFLVWCAWEMKFAQYPMVPRRILNKTVLCVLIIDFFYYFNYYVTDTYFPSYLWVITDLSTRDYTYILQIQTVVLCVFGVVGGIIQRYTHRYKWLQVMGLGVRCIGAGLNYWISLGNTNIATIVMMKILLSAGGGISVIGSQVASQGAVKHKDVAIVIAVLGLWTNVGGAVGAAISAALWTDHLPAELAKHVPSLSADQITSIFGSIEVARAAEPRVDIIDAYNATYRVLSLPALICAFVPFVVACFTHNFSLDSRQNVVEGTLVVAQQQPAGPAALHGVRKDDLSGQKS